MAAQPSILFTVDNFSKGDYGTLGGERAPAGSFKGRNVLVYANGMVGPRPGLRDITPASMPTGKLLFLRSTPVVGKDGLFCIGDTVYRFDLGTPATSPTSIGTFTAVPIVPLHPFLTTDVFYVAVPGNQAYRIDPTNSTVGAVTDSPAGNDLIIRNGQMIISGDGDTNPFYRLLASLPGDVNNWSEGRFLDVGDNWQITALTIQRNYLAILKRNGAYVMSGILGDPDTEVLREVSTSTTTLWPWNAALDPDDRFWFIPVFLDNIAQFDSATVQQLSRLQFDTHEHDDPAGPPLVQGAAIMEGDGTSATFAALRAGSTQQMIAQHNGAWTVHDFGATVSGMCDADHANLIVTDGGDTGVTAKVYSTTFKLNRPAYVSDAQCAPGDNSDTPLDAYVTPPQWWSPAGREVEVRQVVVDFKSWDTGTTETNHFDVVVRVLGRTQDPDVQYAEIVYDTSVDAAPLPFDQDPALSTSDAEGTRQRRKFNFLCVPGAGVEITIKNIRGCAIRSYTVLEKKQDQAPIA